MNMRLVLSVSKYSPVCRAGLIMCLVFCFFACSYESLMYGETGLHLHVTNDLLMMGGFTY